MNMVRYERHEIPPLTEEREAELKALADRPDSEIDYSDIPELDEEFFKNAVRNPFYRHMKTATTVDIDADILAWLKAQEGDYQTRINGILREAMLRTL
jgi:uncharacterized protein (DUF4415 family)